MKHSYKVYITLLLLSSLPSDAMKRTSRIGWRSSKQNLKRIGIPLRTYHSQKKVTKRSPTVIQGTNVTSKRNYSLGRWWQGNKKITKTTKKPLKERKKVSLKKPNKSPQKTAQTIKKRLTKYAIGGLIGTGALVGLHQLEVETRKKIGSISNNLRFYSESPFLAQDIVDDVMALQVLSLPFPSYFNSFLVSAAYQLHKGGTNKTKTKVVLDTVEGIYNILPSGQGKYAILLPDQTTIFLEALYKPEYLISDNGCIEIVELLKEKNPEAHNRLMQKNINKYAAGLKFVSDKNHEKFKQFLNKDLQLETNLIDF